MQEEILLEDEDILVLMPKKAACKGHIIVATKKEYVILEAVPDDLLTKLFQVANKISSVLFEKLQCHGTSLLLQNGVSAGQINKHVSINVLPRYQDDGLKLEWTPHPSSQEDLQGVLNALKDGEQEEQAQHYLETQKKSVEKNKEKKEIKYEEENYLVRQLNRLP